MRLKYYLDQGVSKVELSRRFGISQRTIHHWIATGQLDRDLAAGDARPAPRRKRKHSSTGTRRCSTSGCGSFRGCRRSACSTKCAQPGTRADTAASENT